MINTDIKQQQIETYINLYKSVHGTKPRGLSLHEWTMAELDEGIRVLSIMLERAS
tara:strand:+ start:11188 stop:11352 length:165 start_codon:yes stop_codon:yes gene_type:complete